MANSVYNDPRKVEVGNVLALVNMPLSHEREQVYIDLAHSTCAGGFKFSPPNIHSDVEFARNEGLDGEVYDGLLTTGCVDATMRKIFGEGYVRGGSISTKFIRPVYITDDGDYVEVKFELEGKRKVEGKDIYDVKVSAVDKNRNLIAVGTASARG